MKHALSICAVLLFSGCAATPPASTPLEPQLETLSPGMARVYFLRDSGESLNAKLVRIDVNGKEVGSLANRSSFFIDRIPGNYRISVETFSTPAESAIDVQLEADKHYYVQVAAYERQTSNPLTGGAAGGVLGGALGGAIGGWLDIGGSWAFGIMPLDSSTGETLLRKLMLRRSS